MPKPTLNYLLYISITIISYHAINQYILYTNQVRGQFIYLLHLSIHIESYRVF